MSKCSPSNVTYTANPHYWQPGLPKITKIQYPAYTSNTTANNDLANGNAQWGAQYIPAINAFYTSKSPNYHYWFPPTVNVSLVPNLTNPLLSNVKVRQAMSYAIDRAKVSSIGESGYEPPANQTGIVTPTFSSSLDNAAVAAWGNGYDPAKAMSLLKSAGFHMGSDGIMANSAGQKLSFTVINIGDYSNWVASVQVIQQELKAVGIQITPDNLSNTDFVSDLDYGKYQLAYYDQQTFGPSAYYELNNWLNSANTAPVDKSAASNYERWSSPSTDKLLEPVRDHHGHGHAAVDHEPDTERHGDRGAHHSGRGGGRLVPVRHRVILRLAHTRQPVRAAVRVLLPRQRAGAIASRTEVS